MVWRWILVVSDEGKMRLSENGAMIRKTKALKDERRVSQVYQSGGLN